MSNDNDWDGFVYYSEDKGETWALKGTVFTGVAVRQQMGGIVTDEYGRMYVTAAAMSVAEGTSVYCYYSNDNGATWSATGDSTVGVRTSGNEKPPYLMYDNTGGLMVFYQETD